MSACVVVLRPHTAHSGAVRAIFDARPPQLLPLLAAPMELPPGPWTAPPITLARGVESAAREVAGALRGQRAMRSQPMYPPVTGYPSALAYPATPAYPAYPAYPATPAYPAPSGPPHFAPGYAPAPAAAPRRSHAAAWVLGSIALVLLLAVAAVGGVLALRHNVVPVTHQTPTIPANFTVYTDAHGLYRLNIPADWSTTTNTKDNVITFDSSSNDASFAVTTADFTMTADHIRANEDAFFKAADTAGGGSGTYANLQGPSSVTIAATTWTREAADLTVKLGTLHVVVLIANHSSNAFVLAYGAFTKVYTSTDTSDFQPMLNSFQFLK